MTNKALIILCLFFYYYHISGLATTNILRLTAGSSLPVLSPQCHCDNCGAKITVFMQMPILSYLFCRGHCRNCGIKLPSDQLLLEICVFLGMGIISSALRFTFTSVTLSFLYYEAIRLTIIAIKGKRKTDFPKQYLIAVISMLPPYLLALFLICLYQIV